MAHRYSVESFDTTMRDITGNKKPFGGKIVILGGDFRQVLRLKKNMRALGDTSYSDFLMRVGNGNEPFVANDMIKIPDDMVIPWTGEDSMSQLMDATFPDLENNSEDQGYLLNRALIPPLNEHVDKLNDRVVSMFPGQEHTYYSFDSVEDDFQNLYLQEQLNGIAPGGLPPHELKLKLGALIMLLRNVSAKNGLCNGTRRIIKKFFPNCIDAVILSGNSAGKRVFLHRMPMSPPENLEMPFKMIRKQFPVRMCFSFTINKAQGQTIQNTGMYLPEHVFNHGQLYVGISRGVSSNNTKVLIKKGNAVDKVGTFTKNVVYKEVLTSS
ncbi:uncharacterized protein LOC113279822 [Papaver somniferum]|uniref:uncharacterized protein LOC113279822 n=1 Tax=Papaver somniferum TaxID=3469 RepID=UPI000E6F9BBF|nr:uncharacterized protein LOC113279822 [Papaver somniferum]